MLPLTPDVRLTAFSAFSLVIWVIQQEIAHWQKSGKPEGRSFWQSFRIIPNGFALLGCSIYFIELFMVLQTRPEGVVISARHLMSGYLVPMIMLPPLLYSAALKKGPEKVAFLTKEHESLQAAYPKGAVKITSSHIGKTLFERWLTITYSYPLPLEKILEHNQQELKKLGWILVEYANNDREHYYDYKKDDQKLTWMTLRLWPDKYPDGAAVDGESQISVTIGNRPPTAERYFPPKKAAG